MKTDTPRTDACPYCGDEVCAHPQDDPAWKEYRCGTVYGYYPSDLCREREARQKAEARVEHYSDLINKADDKVLELKAEVERLKKWKDNLLSNLMALEIYKHHHDDDPAVALAAYGQWNWNAGEWEAQRISED